MSPLSTGRVLSELQTEPSVEGCAAFMRLIQCPAIRIVAPLDLKLGASRKTVSSLNLSLA